MPMNQIIHEKRKELGLTQEQIADYLGVSTPAVSKWEKGITSPDTSLLPPLARLLKTDLNTLFCFNTELSSQEIGNFCNELALLGQHDIQKTFKLAQAKIHEFPHNELLLNNVTILLDSLLLQTFETEIPKDSLEEQIVSWYSQLMKSEDEKIKNSSTYMMVNRYIRQDKLELAQSLLDTITDEQIMSNCLPDKLLLQVSIYLKQNLPDKAALILENALLHNIERTHLLLLRLIDAELTDGNTDIAKSLADKSKEMARLFDQWKYNEYVAEYEILSLEKNADKMLPFLKEMLEAMLVPWEFKDSPLFWRMASQTKEFDSKGLLSMLLKQLKHAPDCDYLFEHPKFEEWIQNLESLSQSSDFATAKVL